MNKTFLAAGLLLVGTMLVALGVYQFNQYTVSGTQSAALLKAQAQLYQQSGLDALTIEELNRETARGTGDVNNAILTASVLDIVLGLVLAAAGLLVAGKEHARG